MKFIIRTEKKDISGEIPDSWEDLTVRQFTSLEAGLSEAEILSAMSGIDLDIIENTNINLEPVSRKLSELFSEKPPEFAEAPKGLITIENKEIVFPKNLDFTRFGQKSLVKNLLSQNKEIEMMISDVFAIYAQPLIDGKFTSSRIPEIKATIEDLPIIKVFPYVLFFFKKLRGLRISSKTGLTES